MAYYHRVVSVVTLFQVSFWVEKKYRFLLLFSTSRIPCYFSRRIAPFVIYICRDLNLGALSGVAVFSVDLRIFCCVSPVCVALGDVAEQSCHLVVHS